MPKKIITLDELSRYDENIKEHTGYRLLNSTKLTSLTTSSTEEEIMDAFGGTDEFNNFIEDVLKQKRILVGFKSTNGTGSAYSDVDIQYQFQYGMIKTIVMHFMIPGRFLDYRIGISDDSGWHVYDTYNGVILLNTDESILYTNKAQTITGKKTFSSLPESSIVPTSNYQLTNKKYVDDSATRAQTISAKKTFTVLPESSVVPTTNNQLVNKKYVDDNSILRVDTMPSAGSAYVGKIYQYVGDSTYSYKKGYFYECINVSSYYAWRALGTISSLFIDLTSDLDVAHNYLMPGDYLIKLNSHKLYISHLDGSGERSTTSDIENVPSDYVNVKIFSTPEQYDNRILSFIQSDGNIQIVHSSGGYDAGDYDYEIIEVNSNMVKTTGNQTISGIKTFDVLPRSSVTPTLDNQLVNKAYVDETAAPIQVTSLPSADSSNLDKIYQYIGATNSIYTNGYFYKCMYDGDDYYWESIPVQANVVSTTGAQTITGVKTFSALPQSSVVPTNNNDLVNKSYVDSSITDLTSTVETIATDSDINSLFE